MPRSFYFIEAKSPGLHVFSSFRIPRLGTILLATILKQKGYDTRVFVEDVAKPDWKAFRGVGMVGVSAITSTAPRAYRIADRFRAEGKTVVMGGPHPTFMPDEALLHSDFVVRGEGEETLTELLDALEAGRPPAGIKGLSYRDGVGNVHNPPRDFIRNLDGYPIPDFSLVEGWSRKDIIPVATSRGCPFECRFCSVIHMFGRRYRFKTLDAVMAEIRSVYRKGCFVFFVDDNFTADRRRTKELLRAIIRERLKFEWGAQVRCDAAEDTELLGLMKDSGCANVYIGFESVNPKTLERFNKRQDIEDIKRAIVRFRERGIRIHGMFVLGSDEDDQSTIAATKDFALKMKLESVQFLILTPLPGTPLYDELSGEGRLLHTDWSKYDAHHTVHRPALMTPAELQRGAFGAMAGFYSWGRILRYVARFNFYCGALNLYGKMSVQKARAEGEEYLRGIRTGKPLPRACPYPAPGPCRPSSDSGPAAGHRSPRP